MSKQNRELRDVTNLKNIKSKLFFKLNVRSARLPSKKDSTPCTHLQGKQMILINITARAYKHVLRLTLKEISEVI
jgi:hypothetical protein